MRFHKMKGRLMNAEVEGAEAEERRRGTEERTRVASSAPGCGGERLEEDSTIDEEDLSSSSSMKCFDVTCRLPSVYGQLCFDEQHTANYTLQNCRITPLPRGAGACDKLIDRHRLSEQIQNIISASASETQILRAKGGIIVLPVISHESA